MEIKNLDEFKIFLSNLKKILLNSTVSGRESMIDREEGRKGCLKYAICGKTVSAWIL